MWALDPAANFALCRAALRAFARRSRPRE